MKALIESSGRVAEVRANTFPVHPSLMWVDCADSITTRHTYKDGAFVEPSAPVEMPPMPSLAEQIIDNPTELAKLKAALGVA